MPKRVPESELAAIVELIRRSAEPVSLNDVYSTLPFNLTRRTLQRRLAQLAKEGRLIVISDRGGRRYGCPQAPSPPAAAAAAPEQHAIPSIPLCRESTETRSIITRPLSARMPVGHQAEFLDAYQPNLSAYLPPALREKLAQMGRVGQSGLPAGTYVRQIYNRLLIDLSWNSSRLEGNTYSLLDTQRLLELGEQTEGKDARDAQMILNHKAAIELLVDDVVEIGFNRYTLCNLHALLSENLLSDPGASGRVRSREVAITGSVYQPLNVPQVVEEQFRQVLDKATEIDDPFEQAFFVMVHIPYLQPFEDVNKRVSRLAANIPMVRQNLCPLSFVDVPRDDYTHAMLAIYELNRTDYLRDLFAWAYERSASRYSVVRQSLGQPDPFRLKYRGVIADLVAEVVRSALGKREAAAHVAARAGRAVAEADRDRLVEVVETELIHLHEGSIARYRLRPAEFERWIRVWT